MEKTFI